MTTYEVAHRTRKVAALLATIDELGITANEMRGADEAAWQQIAHEAGVNVPSVETRRQVIGRMDALEADLEAEAAWEDTQEYAGNRCPPRE